MPDAPWLTIDRGNTTLDCRVVGAGVSARRRLAPRSGALAEMVGAWRDAGVRPVAAVGCSVVAAANHELRREADACGIDLQLAGVDLPCRLRLDYPEPSTLGVDRQVAAYAASCLHGDALVFDCGTAVTVDAVTADGHFLGGSIGLGLGSQARALAAAAPVLPAFDCRAPEGWPPNTSLDAVRAGIGLGFLAQLRDLAARLEAAFAAAGVSPTRVLTGGDAPAVLALDPEFGALHAPELVHDGLLLLGGACGSG